MKPRLNGVPRWVPRHGRKAYWLADLLGYPRVTVTTVSGGNRAERGRQAGGGAGAPERTRARKPEAARANGPGGTTRPLVPSSLGDRTLVSWAG